MPDVEFHADYAGSTIGLGYDCVVLDEPPHGAWTVFLVVTDPMQTSLLPGEELCAVVHSPSLYQSFALRDVTQGVGCRITAGGFPRRFECGEATGAPSMAVFDHHAAWTWFPTERAPMQSRDDLSAANDALWADLQRFGDCLVRADVESTASLVKLARRADAALSQDTTAEFDSTLAEVTTSRADVATRTRECSEGAPLLAPPAPAPESPPPFDDGRRHRRER